MDLLASATRHRLQRHRELDFNIGASWWPRGTTSKKPVKHTAAKSEVQTAQDIFEVDSAEKILRREACHPRESLAIVLHTLLGVRQHGVSFGDFFEALLRTRFLVPIWVILERELTKGGLDRLLVRVAGNAENFVEVSLCNLRDTSPSRCVMNFFELRVDYFFLRSRR